VRLSILDAALGRNERRRRGLPEECRTSAQQFDGFTITPQAADKRHPDDETLLVGPVPDQAALHGLLAKIRDLGLPLLSVKRVEAASLAEE